MEKNDIKKILEQEGEILIKKISLLIKEINIPEPLVVSINLAKDDNIGFIDIEEYKNNSIVYFLMLEKELESPDLRKDIEKLFDEIRGKKGKGEWLVSAINDSNWETGARCLYVGSSRKDIITRMNQHFANTTNSESRKAYSLWLKDWFNESGLSKNINVYFLVFKDKSHDDIYMIEDLLWRNLKPLFGRSGKGPKSKAHNTR